MLQARNVEGDLLCVERKFGGLEVRDAKRLQWLEEENTRLKRLLADTMLDNADQKDLLSRKWYTLSVPRPN